MSKRPRNSSQTERIHQRRSTTGLLPAAVAHQIILGRGMSSCSWRVGVNLRCLQVVQACVLCKSVTRGLLMLTFDDIFCHFRQSQNVLPKPIHTSRSRPLNQRHISERQPAQWSWPRSTGSSGTCHLVRRTPEKSRDCETSNETNGQAKA